MKFLLISGSPRKGNTEFVLRKLYELLEGEKELVLLREKNIKHCQGCLSCDKSNKCVLHDDMEEICQKLIKAEVIVIGTPNYFNNVSGLLKDFIDRTNPFYGTDILKGKKLIVLVAGDREEKYLKKVIRNGFSCFVDCHRLDLKNFFYFRGINPNDTANNPKSLKLIEKIAKLCNSF